MSSQKTEWHLIKIDVAHSSLCSNFSHRLAPVSSQYDATRTKGSSHAFTSLLPLSASPSRRVPVFRNSYPICGFDVSLCGAHLKVKCWPALFQPDFKHCTVTENTQSSPCNSAAVRRDRAMIIWVIPFLALSLPSITAMCANKQDPASSFVIVVTIVSFLSGLFMLSQVTAYYITTVTTKCKLGATRQGSLPASSYIIEFRETRGSVNICCFKMFIYPKL